MIQKMINKAMVHATRPHYEQSAAEHTKVSQATEQFIQMKARQERIVFYLTVTAIVVMIAAAVTMTIKRLRS